MSSSALNEPTLADIHKIMQVLKKYGNSETVQKILKECFDDNNADTEFRGSVSSASSTPFAKREEIV